MIGRWVGDASILADLTIGLGGGRRLVLAGSGQGWLWLLAGAAALGLVLVLYRYERRLVTRRAGLALLGLRLAAAAALVFALFEPIAERSRTESVRGRLVVGVDLSESMATADPGRPPDESAKLAETLGLGPTEPVEALSRREIARRLLGTDLMRRLSSEHDVELVGFARESVAGLSPEALADRLAGPSDPDNPSSLATDWRPVLERGLEGRDDRPTIGVVLLTDGLANLPGDASDDPAADRLAARGVPVFPVLIGSTARPIDAAVAGLRVPDRVAKGDAADVEVTLKLDGPEPGTTVPVQLERPGAEPLRQSVTVPADGSRPSVSFRVPMEEVGTVPLTVTVGPIEGDTRPDNDRRTAAVEVVDDTSRVLLVASEAGWEFRYLRNALRRDPHVEVEAVVLRPPPSAPLASGEPPYGTRLPPPVVEGPDPLNAFDAILIGSVAQADLDAETWGRLEAYVDARGGTLVLAGLSDVVIASNENVRKLLPVLDPRPLPVDPQAADPNHPSLPAGVTVLPASAAGSEDWPMLRLAADAERSRAVWASLPGLPGALGGRAKPAASPLLTARVPGMDEDVTTIAAASPYGLGKVLWIGTDGTWRWRHRVGDVYHHRFWGQVVRWSAAARLAAGNRLVRFGPLRPRVVESQAAPIRAQFADEATGVGPGLLVAAKVFRAATTGEGSGSIRPEGEALAIVPLRASTGQPRVFDGAAPSLPPGVYAVTLEAPQLDGMPTDAAPLEIAARVTSERVELAANRDTLERLAGPNDGRVFADFEADALPARLQALVKPRTRVESTTLWDGPLALGLFFAILAGEWALRKRVGLP